MLSTSVKFMLKRGLYFRSSRSMSILTDHLKTQLQGIQDAGTYKSERVITTAQDTEIGVTTSDQKVLNFCANNYLGLSNHPEIVKAAKDTLDTHGFGLSSVRFICGTQDIHKQLEKEISEFHGMEDTILYPSCFDANAGLFEAILTNEDAIISDSLNHASIIDGVRLCKAKRYRYNHMDMAHLEECLKDSQSQRFRLIATDGVFSMDGHIAPLPEIVKLAEKYNAQIYMDECHATGFFGKTGRGTDEYHGVQGKIDIINSTLGKALGGATGGYTTGPQEVIDMLRQKSRPYLFSNSLAPSVAGASLKVMEMLRSSTELRDKLDTNTQHFRRRMAEVKFDLGESKDHPICPVMLGDARLAARFADEMLKLGIYVVGFSYPVVPHGQARIRVQISSAHSEQDIDRAVDAFISIRTKLAQEDKK